MVTLLGVRSIGVETAFSLAAAETVSPRGGVKAGSKEEAADVRGSADMLLRVRSPLSRRGRFLLTEESASSIRFRRGGLGPAEVARVGVRGRPIEGDSMTFYFWGGWYNEGLGQEMNQVEFSWKRMELKETSGFRMLPTQSEFDQKSGVEW